ncbi:MAG: 2-hydroxyacyl-CoA dehydratase [Peptococcaceae bacterium]|jgi:benzoyl-CoA reductase subunit B|nr:2-hydroxyacyl-CoA dehydratase [Peptococcaceae bacterium]
MKGQIWETRPLEYWAKAKELRAKWERSSDRPDKVVGQGNTSFVVDWQQAFPAITVIEDNPRGSTIAAKNLAEARRFRLASDIRGWGREICGYHGVFWGSQFIGYQPDGAPFAERNFVIPIPCVCDCHTKRGMQCRDYKPVPQWQSDYTCYIGPYDAKREAPMLEHRNYCLYRVINDLERVLGQQLNEEELLELIRTSNEVKQYRQEIFTLMAHKPAPLSIKELYSTYVLGGLVKLPMNEVMEFWKLVRDEVKWRTENDIAAVGTERYRWMEAHPPGYYFLKYYRYMEKYGAVCIGSQYTNFTFAQLERKPDGSIADRDFTVVDENMKAVRMLADGTPVDHVVYEPIFSRDMPILTREDAIRFITGADARAPHHFKQDEYLRPYALNEFADIYQVDGALLPLWRSGVGCTLTRKEQAMRLRQAGVNVYHYEGNQGGDNTDFDEKRMLEQLDQWMESQGLRKFED